MMDCDTTGVEPDIALIKYKKLVGEGFLQVVNVQHTGSVKKLGYSATQVEEGDQVRKRARDDRGRTAPQARAPAGLRLRLQAGQRRRMPIHYMGHVRMMGTIQPFISGAMSKTVDTGRGDRAGLPRRLEAGSQGDRNLPRQLEAQPTAVDRQEGARRGGRLRGRDQAQEGAGQGPEPPSPIAGACRRAIRGTHRFDIAGHKSYVRVSLLPDGQPAEEYFLKLDGVGSPWTRSPPDRLRSHCSTEHSVRDLVNKFAHVRFDCRLPPATRRSDRQVDRRLHLPVAGSVVEDRREGHAPA